MEDERSVEEPQSRAHSIESDWHYTMHDVGRIGIAHTHSMLGLALRCICIHNLICVDRLEACGEVGFGSSTKFPLAGA